MQVHRSDVKFTINAAFFQEIKEDHQHLHDLLDSLEDLSEHREALPDHRHDFARLLGELRDQLAFHFTLEEAYGYFEDAIDCSPWLHNAAGELRNQHNALYLKIGDIANRADHSCRNADANEETCNFTPIAEAYATFRQQLSSHEAAEMKLILDAMNSDVGTGD